MIGRRFAPSTEVVDKPKGFDDFDLRLGDLMRGERATLGKSLLDVQRELKIKAAYIAAIENADVAAFEAPGFIAGYVRSYARYLGMDADVAFARFCAEAGFEVAHGMSSAASSPARVAQRNRFQAEGRDPIANPDFAFFPKAESVWANVHPGALGSITVLVALIGALGYGGWSVLQQVQRVDLAPVEAAPLAVTQIDTLEHLTPAKQEAELAAAGVVVDPVDRLYRPPALDVPVLVSRDGPIAEIDPDKVGLLADANKPMPSGETEDVKVVADAAPGVEILAVRPSWVRVAAQDGTVLFEKILDAGERYAVPQLEEAPVLHAGNSGSIYFAVNGVTYGPAAEGASVVKNLPLGAESLTQTYAQADPAGDADLARFTALAAIDSSAVTE